MPTLLELFKDEEPRWYEIICSFKFHFSLNFLVDVLQKLNKLNIESQHDMVDITTISAIIVIIFQFYHIIFKPNNGHVFGRTSKNLENS